MGLFARLMTGMAIESPDGQTISIDATYLKAHRTTSSQGLEKEGGADVFSSRKNELLTDIYMIKWRPLIGQSGSSITPAR